MRSSKHEECMICGDVPCSCFTRVRKATKSQPLPDVTGPDIPSGPTAAQRAIQAAVVAQRDLEIERRFLGFPAHRTPRPVNLDEVLHADAIRTVVAAGIVHPDEVDRYRVVTGTPPTLDERAAIWRARHGHND